MAFTDPQTITIAGTANTLPRTSSGVNSGAFTKSDGNLQMLVSHAYGKRVRRTIRINHRKIVSDPLLTATNVEKTASVYLVIDAPTTGYTTTELVDIASGFATKLTASTNAALTQLLGGEN